MQLPLLRVGDLDDGHADPAQYLEVGPRIAAHVGDTAEEEDGRVDAALHQSARDHESVAAVVAAATHHPDAAGRKIVERRFHRRDRLTPGILHQHDRRNPDVLDRAAIGFAHLFGVEHSHAFRSSVLLVLDCGQLAAQLSAFSFQLRSQQSQKLRLRADELRAGELRSERVKGAVYVNGIITPAREAVIPVYDHGFVYGEGVYETLRTYNRVPFLYDRHLRRLRASAAALHLDVPFDDDTLLGWIHDTMAVAERSPEGLSTPTPPIPPLKEAYIRILLTRGVGDLSYDLTATPAPSLVIIVKPFDEPPARMFDEGIKIVLVSILRNHPGSVNPIIKSNNLLNNALAMQEARRQGGEEALMCNYRGELSECAQSNFFLVRDGVALTPRSASGLLEGLTRAFLFEVGARGRRAGRGSHAHACRSHFCAGSVHHRVDTRAHAGRPDRRPDDRQRPPGAGDAQAAGRISKESLGTERAGPMLKAEC